MTIESLIEALESLPKDYEVSFSGHEDVPESEVTFVISHKERFIILKYKSYLEEIKRKI